MMFSSFSDALAEIWFGGNTSSPLILYVPGESPTFFLSLALTHYKDSLDERLHAF